MNVSDVCRRPGISRQTSSLGGPGSLARRIGDWREHLAATDPPLSFGVLHHRLATGIAVFVAETFEDTAGSVPLFWERLAVFLEDLPDHQNELFKLRPLLGLPIPRRLVVREDFLQRVPANSVFPFCISRSPPVCSRPLSASHAECRSRSPCRCAHLCLPLKGCDRGYRTDRPLLENGTVVRGHFRPP
jgi:hypothetical protein